MNWYSINFSLGDTEDETVIEIMEWFKNYLHEHFLFNEALLYETDELTRQGITVFIYSCNADLISALRKKCHLEKCAQPVKEEICLVAGSRDFGDSLFIN